MATSRSDRSRSQQASPSEKTFWEAIETLQKEVAALKQPIKSRSELFLEVPIGGIIAWSKPLAEIPDNYALCDGTNGTPDLRQKFLRGIETSADNPGNTGGAETHVHDGAEGTMVAMEETAGTPAGTNGATSGGTPDAHTVANDTAVGGAAARLTGPAAHGALAPHTHAFTGTEMDVHMHLLEGETQEVDHRPPYYDVAWIMRVS